MFVCFCFLFFVIQVLFDSSFAFIALVTLSVCGWNFTPDKGCIYHKILHYYCLILKILWICYTVLFGTFFVFDLYCFVCLFVCFMQSVNATCDIILLYFVAFDIIHEGGWIPTLLLIIITSSTPCMGEAEFLPEYHSSLLMLHVWCLGKSLNMEWLNLLWFIDATHFRDIYACIKVTLIHNCNP